MASKMDPKKRKFLKHLGLLGFGALIGLGITHATSPSETEITNRMLDEDLASGRKRIWDSDEEKHIWESEKERNENLKPKKHGLRVGGKPIILLNVCAYHADENADGIYESSEEGKYCTMPCKDICPVDAITKHEVTDGTYDGKIVPQVDVEKCIGCTNCFKYCGYNAIEWVNYK